MSSCGKQIEISFVVQIFGKLEILDWLEMKERAADNVTTNSQETSFIATKCLDGLYENEDYT